MSENIKHASTIAAATQEAETAVARFANGSDLPAEDIDTEDLATPISEIGREFYGRLIEHGRKRIAIDIIRRVFAELFPERESHPERTAYLKNELLHLVAAGLIAFPSKTNRRGWLPETSPLLPAWVVIIKRPEQRLIADPANIPWLAELSFCAELTRARSIEAAIAINDFLIEHRHELMQVPLRERSLQIFGNEKRLDTLVANGALFGGRLPLAVIGAFEIEQPLAFVAAGIADRPILVVENHHTYWSFCNWNTRRKTYSAVVYGAGSNFSNTGNAIDVVMAQVNGNGIEYFGDLDPAGLEIPVSFNHRRMRTAREIAKPATNLYQYLLTKGIKRTFFESNALCKSREEELVEWLSCQKQIAETLELFKNKQWIPQESLGTEALLKFF